MENHSSWQTQQELKTGKIKKKESNPKKQNKENKGNKLVVVKEKSMYSQVYAEIL